LAVTLLIFPAFVQAQDRDPAQLAGEITGLERAIAQHEAAGTGKPDPAKEMQYLLSMAKLAKLYMQAGRFQESWPLSEKMLSGIEKLFGPEHPSIVNPLEATASVYAMQGRYAEAEKLRKRAIAINERTFGSDSLNVAFSLRGLANLFRLEDRPEEGLELATRALGIADHKLPPDDSNRAVFLSEAADIYVATGRHDMAEPLLKRALAIVEKAKTENSTVTGLQTIQYLQNLGLSYLMRGRPAEAQPLIDRAIATSTKLFGPDHPMTGAMLITLAMQLAEREKLDEAERLYTQALPISEKSGVPRSEAAQNYIGLGLVEVKRKNWRKAYNLLSKGSAMAIALEKLAGDETITGGRRAAPNADIFLLNAVAAYRTAELEPKDSQALRDAAFQLAQRAGRSLAARALTQMATRVGAGGGELGKLVREKQDLTNEWRSLDKRLEQALAKPLTERDAAKEQGMRERMAAFAKRLEAIGSRLANDFPDFSELSDPEPLSIEEVQRQLRPREAMIFAAPRSNQTLVWVITPNSTEWSLIPAGETELAPEIAALRCGLDETAWQGAGGKVCADLTGRAWRGGESLPFDLARANRLYGTLLEPFATSTKDAHLLAVILGPLAALPLHVLVTEPPAIANPPGAAGYAQAAWLTKRNAISYLPSVSSLKALRVTAKPSRAERPYFGIANPLLDGPDARYAYLSQAARTNRTCAATVAGMPQLVTARGSAPVRAVPPAELENGLARSGFIRAQVPLPETADEICAVARDFGVGEADIRLADRATETEIKHMSDSGELAKYRILHFATHAALAGQVSNTSEAGLILTPPKAATAIDDGYLTPPEISTLKLDADWVILSACNTAREGRAGGEALSELARAFFYAQARAVLASHWEVDSRATVTLIAAASAALQREPYIGRAEAIRRAMLRLIDNGTGGTSHPQYWAPFVLVGEGGRDPRGF
jgi:CHAT domain-containing protein/tetratricopeptide (TPR) repeat protein